MVQHSVQVKLIFYNRILLWFKLRLPFSWLLFMDLFLCVNQFSSLCQIAFSKLELVKMAMVPDFYNQSLELVMYLPIYHEKVVMVVYDVDF